LRWVLALVGANRNWGQEDNLERMTESLDRTSRGAWFAKFAVATLIGWCCVMLAGYYVPAYEGVDQNGHL
jgi:hypothetical protein